VFLLVLVEEAAWTLLIGSSQMLKTRQVTLPGNLTIKFAFTTLEKAACRQFDHQICVYYT
jgi:hypothetical protein